ncbi:hypothetical protein K2173_008927 [Erythroxylum novogranatense]|uniref:UBX domain-containing protein n=1 Tax=Erythroxylum novogranatense TaxID=1862640 RepID=A0AAV8TV96_9ROSI|nr:hypothetical protein K2173_008927 [Erythroxylum novogranatense]
MEGMLSPSDKQRMVSSFLEIAVGQTADTARQFLQATSWKLEEAIQLFYIGNEGGVVASTQHSPPRDNTHPWEDTHAGLKDFENENENENVGPVGGEEVRPPLPVVRDTLYDDAMLYRASRVGHPVHEPSPIVAFRNFDEEMRRPGVWESDQGGAATSENPRDNLASLYRPPIHLMFQGSFEKAKGAASVQDKWLLVNLQSTKEFSSHMLNRDTWANEAVAQTIGTNFIFWQVYDDTSEGKKVCTYYKLDSVPAVLVIDPITGQKMRSWSGMVQPENLLEDLVAFMDGGPRDHHKTLSHKRPRGSSWTPDKDKVETNEEDEEVQRALVASMECMKESATAPSNDKDVTSPEVQEKPVSPGKPTYPPLPEEPKCDRSLLCRVGVRLPNGRRMQRSFLKSDPIQLLWSFCYSQLEEPGTRRFRLTEAIPGAKNLDYETKMSFEESGLANSMIFVAWE